MAGKVYVINILDGVNDFTKRVHIKDLFEQFGEVAACWLPPVGHRHSDFGYVKFKRQASADAAIKACKANQVELWGKKIKAEHRVGACTNHDDHDFDARGSNLTSARELFKATLLKKSRRPPSSSSSSSSSSSGKKKPRKEGRGDRGGRRGGDRGKRNQSGADAIVQRMLEDRGRAGATARQRSRSRLAIGDDPHADKGRGGGGNGRRQGGRDDRDEPYDDRDGGRRQHQRRDRGYDEAPPRYERGRVDDGGRPGGRGGDRRGRRPDNGRDDRSPSRPREVSNSPGGCVSNSPGGGCSNSPGRNASNSPGRTTQDPYGAAPPDDDPPPPPEDGADDAPKKRRRRVRRKPRDGEDAGGDDDQDGGSGNDRGNGARREPTAEELLERDLGEYERRGRRSRKESHRSREDGGRSPRRATVLE